MKTYFDQLKKRVQPRETLICKDNCIRIKTNISLNMLFHLSSVMRRRGSPSRTMWKLIFNRFFGQIGIVPCDTPPTLKEFYLFASNSKSDVVWKGAAHQGTGNTTKTHSLLRGEKEQNCFTFLRKKADNIYIYILPKYISVVFTRWLKIPLTFPTRLVLK